MRQKILFLIQITPQPTPRSRLCKLQTIHPANPDDFDRTSSQSFDTGTHSFTPRIGKSETYEEETVLVFGGIDPHVEYGLPGNTGKDIYRYLQKQNLWEFVGEMPEARHHHSLAYMNGRIYLVGKYKIINLMTYFAKLISI